jgi:hypothetical protein
MKKFKLKFRDFYQLDYELNGLINRETGDILSTGLLLNENLKLATQYWLNDLNTKVVAEVKAIEKLKESMVKKYGKEQENGDVFIPMFLDEENTKINPDYENFQKELNELLDNEKEIECFEFTLSQFEKVETRNLPGLFKLIKPDEQTS